MNGSSGILPPLLSFNQSIFRYFPFLFNTLTPRHMSVTFYSIFLRVSWKTPSVSADLELRPA